MKYILLFITLTIMAHPLYVQAEEIRDKEPLSTDGLLKEGR